MNRARYICLAWFVLIVSASRDCAADLVAARAALDRDDYAMAVTLAENALATNKEDPQAWIVLGHGLSGQIDQANLFRKPDLARRALAAYQQAVKLSPQDVEAHASLLEYYFRAPTLVGGGRNKADEEAATLARLDPPLALTWRIRFALFDGRSQPAFEYCEELIKIEPESYRALYWLAATCASTHQQLGRGLGAIQRAILLTPGENDPDPDDAYLRLSELLEYSGELKEALRACEKAISMNPRNREARSRLVRLQKETS